MDDELQTHVARAFDFDEPPATFEAFWEQLLRTFTEALGRPVTTDDLCTTDESPHRAIVDGDTHHYQCVTDAFILAGTREEAVTVRTVSPVADRELAVEFDADGGVSTPDGAVLSFGVDRSVEAPDGPVTPAAMYGRVCPYTKAFASRAEYDRWLAANPDVVADVLPLDDALALLAHLVGTAQPAGEPDRVMPSAGDGCSCC
jgi:alkylmercury lyase